MKKEIKILNDRFLIYLGGDYLGDYESLIEAQDTLDDEFTAAMDGDHKYRCDFCQEWFDEQQVEHRIEDQSFTAPLGEIFVLGKDVGCIPLCPICGLDLEET